MKGIRREFTKLYSYLYFIFWGFYFSAGYFYCKNIKSKSFLGSSYLTCI
nr:hypothetical protein [uncultured Intestinibacter sp.]